MTQPPAVYYQQIVRPPSNGLAIAALVLGIVAILPGLLVVVPIVGLFFAFFAFVPGVLAIVFGHLGLSTAKRLNGLGAGSAKAGLILGYVTIGLIVATTFVWIVVGVIGAATSGV